MSTFEKNMSEIFDVPAKVVEEKLLPAKVEKVESTVVANLDSDLDKDYEDARKTQQNLIQKGNLAIDHLLAIASETEHPRAFEVVATLIKNTAEANEKLLTMQKTMRDLKNIKQKDSAVNVDKAIFVGSTAELNKLIKSKNENI